MATLFDIDLEQIAHVVEGGSSLAEMTLLFDARGLGIPLHDNQPTKHRTILARHLLPRLLALVGAEIDPAVLLTWREQDAPAVLRHSHVFELGPALGGTPHGSAQVNLRGLEAFRPTRHPPADVAWMPLLQRLEHALVVG